MDSRSQTKINGSSRSDRSMGAVFVLGVVLSCSVLSAFPPPTIRATGTAQTLTVLDPTLPTVFPEQGWKIVAPNPLGPTIAIWHVEPFRNKADTSILVDAQLNLRMTSNGRSGGWQVLIPAARTQFLQGWSMAQVVAASQGGNGDAAITVAFLGHEQPLIADGVFETTVVGTITEAF